MSSAKMFYTKNLAKFVQNEMNRDVKKIKPLVESMRKHGYLAAYPLHCFRETGGKLRVKAGHHRLEASKALGIGVYYVVLEDNASIVELETSTRPWSFHDYVAAHVRSGNRNVTAILDFHKETGIRLGQSASLLGGECANSSNVLDRVKDGTIELSRNWHADKVGSCIKCATAAGVKFATTAGFVGAISHIAWCDEFNMKAFCKKVQANPGALRKCATRDLYVEMLEEFYNFGLRVDNRVPLKLLAKQAAARRSVSFLEQSA